MMYHIWRGDPFFLSSWCGSHKVHIWNPWVGSLVLRAFLRVLHYVTWLVLKLLLSSHHWFLVQVSLSLEDNPGAPNWEIQISCLLFRRPPVGLNFRVKLLTPFDEKKRTFKYKAFNLYFSHKPQKLHNCK